MIPGHFHETRAVLDFLASATPVALPPKAQHDGMEPVLLAPDGSIRIRPWCVAEKVFCPVSRKNVAMVRRTLRAIGWAPAGRVLGSDPYWQLFAPTADCPPNDLPGALS